MIKLIVGLGNIGSEYADTRHNAGQWFIQRIADACGESFKLESKFSAEVAKVNYQGKNLWLAFPTTYMNLSGHAVQKICQFYKINLDEILVAHDELDIPSGQARLKKGGGHGGHNGLRDIHQMMGSADYWRLRIGIDHPGHKSKVSGFVLSKPTQEQKIEIDHAIDRAFDQLGTILSGNIADAMNQLHRQ